MSWTDELTDKLKTLHAEGLTYVQIGNRLGITWSAADAKAKRLGLNRRRPDVGSYWTDERVEMLRKLYAEGASFSHIAETLGGITRNAAIGKAHRIGLRGRPEPSEPRAPRQAAPRSHRPAPAARISAPKPGPEQGGSTPLAVRAKRLSVIVDKAASEPVKPRHPRHNANLSLFDGPGGRPWIERRFGECAWPVGGDGADTRSCCAPTFGEGVYCDFHARAAYQPARVTQRADSAARKVTLKAARAA